MTPGIELHVQELVLHGFAPGDRSRLGRAVQRELARLLAEQGVPPSLARGAEIERVDGGSLEVASGAAAERIGAQVAQAVYGGLAR
jgi:hypothetical protein